MEPHVAHSAGCRRLYPAEDNRRVARRLPIAGGLYVLKEPEVYMVMQQPIRPRKVKSPCP